MSSTPTTPEYTGDLQRETIIAMAKMLVRLEERSVVAEERSVRLEAQVTQLLSEQKVSGAGGSSFYIACCKHGVSRKLCGESPAPTANGQQIGVVGGSGSQRLIPKKCCGGQYMKMCGPGHRPVVFYDICTQRGHQWILTGRIVMELFADVVPMTAEHFRCLWTGELETAGSQAHTAAGVAAFVAGFGWSFDSGSIQAQGSTVNGSIYGCELAHESFQGVAGRHDVGSLSLSEGGRSFFICTTPRPERDGKHVVFGRVVAGLDVLQGLSEAGQVVLKGWWGQLH